MLCRSIRNQSPGKGRPDQTSGLFPRHGRARPGHPRLRAKLGSRGWPARGRAWGPVLIVLLLLLARLPADIAPAEAVGPFDPVDRGIGALPRLHHRLARGADIEHTAAIGEKCAVLGDRSGLEDFD